MDRAEQQAQGGRLTRGPRSIDHLAHVAAMRQLAGRELPVHTRIAETVAAINALHAGSKSWTAFAPRRSSLDAAVAQADAVARSLRELRAALHADVQEGAIDAR